MSWLFSQAVVEAFSAGTSLAGKPCAQLNVMPTVRPFWHRDKMIESLNLSRYGQTSRRLTPNRGEELLMSCLAVFRARPTPTAGSSHAGGYLGEWGGKTAREKMRTLVSEEELFGPLNPMWVEWLMAFPRGWTDLAPLATHKFHEWRLQHGNFSFIESGRQHDTTQNQ